MDLKNIDSNILIINYIFAFILFWGQNTDVIFFKRLSINFLLKSNVYFDKLYDKNWH